MRTSPTAAAALAALLLAPLARAQEASDDPAKIAPTAHANPTAPPPAAFDEGQLPPGHPPIDGAGEPAGPLPPGHPPIDGSADQAGPLPPGHPAISADAAPDSADTKKLLEKLDAMKDELANRPKTAEIEFALGNLYYENGRYPEAIDYYRQLIERAKGPMDRWLAVRAKPHRSLTPEQAGCPAASKPSFDQLVAIADGKAAAGDSSAAETCYEGALLPVVIAMARRANAFFLVGNPDRAVQEHRKVLAIEPDFTDSLFFLGAILYETGDGDAGKLREAKDAWTRFLTTDPEPERAKLVRQNLAKVDSALRNGGRLPPEPGQGGPMFGPGFGPIGAPAPPPELTARDQKALAAAVAQGQKRLDARDWAGALVAFDRARKLDRADASAATGAGLALLNLGQRADAEAAFRDALGRDPRDGTALYGLGEVFFENEHYAGAARFWKQLLSSDPKVAKKYGVEARLQAAEAAN